MEKAINKVKNFHKKNLKQNIMKTQNSKLVFKKSSISELNTNQLSQINGGTVSSISPMLPTSIITVSIITNGSQGEDIQSR
ncbi:bacteriocin-like protein [Lacinutrix venerupis]|nr:bacteriocin-like protein [Lacinutrix venerupis]